MTNKNNIRIGDSVVFSKTFLRSIAAKATDLMWHQKGVVVDIQCDGSLAILDDGFERTPYCHCQCDSIMHAHNGATIGACLNPDCTCPQFDNRRRVNINNLARRSSAAANFDKYTD